MFVCFQYAVEGRPQAFSIHFVDKALISVANDLSLRRLKGLPFM